jgi:hypothetical protein
MRCYLLGGLIYLLPLIALGVAMRFLPTSCPDCNGLTMQVVEYEPDDSYEARCTDCGCRSLGKISPELLIVKGDIDSD